MKKIIKIQKENEKKNVFFSFLKIKFITRENKNVQNFINS